MRRWSPANPPTPLQTTPISNISVGVMQPVCPLLGYVPSAMSAPVGPLCSDIPYFVHIRPLSRWGFGLAPFQVGIWNRPFPCAIASGDYVRMMLVAKCQTGTLSLVCGDTTSGYLLLLLLRKIGHFALRCYVPWCCVVLHCAVLRPVFFIQVG